MTAEPRWITLSDAVVAHERLIARYGGTPGIRDQGLLESALARPENLFAYEAEKSVPVLAAALAFALAKNHPFVDGNKRVAFAALSVFLEINGFELTASQESAAVSMERLAGGELSEDGFRAWVVAESAPKRPNG